MIQWFRYAINGIIVTVLALLLVVFVLPRAAGYKPYVVVSASMQQSFPVGSLIYVRDAVPEEIAVGDPITFASGSLVITHRVIDIDSEQRIFTTNDVGSDIRTYDEGTTAYIRALGRINAALADRADTVLEIVAGIPLLIKGEMPA